MASIAKRVIFPMVLLSLAGCSATQTRTAQDSGVITQDEYAALKEKEAQITRLEQELVFVSQKMDVDEEVDRLDSHIDEVRRVLERDEPVGRRLDFLMQELNREANTLGSKSADSETTAVSVEMKVLIEQMREQVQNIE